MSAIAEAARRLGGPRSLELPLICGPCGKRGNYRVGAAVVDAERLDDTDAAISFTGIFTCDGCGAEGPWKIPTMARMRLLAKLLVRNTDVMPGRVSLFDGTSPRTGAEAVRHLRALLERDPKNACLWNRLGNVYQSGGVLEEAVRAWERAIEIDADDLESRYSLGIVAFEAGLSQEAIPHLHDVLRLAGEKKGSIPVGRLRELLKETLRTLLDLREELGDKVDVFPTAEPSAARRDEPTTLHVTSFDLSREEEWDRWADLVMGIGEVSSTLRDEKERRRRKRRW